MNKFSLNNVYNTDVMEVLKNLPAKSIDMVYGDPDYNVGIRYNDKSYTTNFQEYVDWYIELTQEALRVLKDSGNLFLINYPKQNAYLRTKYLDNVCYEVLDYVWIYNTNIGHSPKRFTTAHRSILHCRKTKNNKFYKENVAVPYKNPTDKRILDNIHKGSKGRMPYDWFYFDLVKNISKDKTFHPCQIPTDLTEMLIKASTKESDSVFILFGGSGNEILLCKKLKRKFISAEIDKKYYNMIIDRLKNNGIIKTEHRLKSVSHKEDKKFSLFNVLNPSFIKKYA